jgi:hypothetical protein
MLPFFATAIFGFAPKAIFLYLMYLSVSQSVTEIAADL